MTQSNELTENMITFDHFDRRFKYRVAGLCIHENYVLLTKADQDDY